MGSSEKRRAALGSFFFSLSPDFSFALHKLKAWKRLSQRFKLDSEKLSWGGGEGEWGGGGGKMCDEFKIL